MNWVFVLIIYVLTFGYLALIVFLAQRDKARSDYKALWRELKECGIDRCPACNIPFSDWFIWPERDVDDLRYCYPCWTKTRCIIRPANKEKQS